MGRVDEPRAPAAEEGEGWAVPGAAAGERVVDVCRDHLGGVARRAIGPLIAAGDVTVDGRPSRIADPVAAGQVLRVTPGTMARLAGDGLVTPPSERALTVVHADDDLLVVDKPAGLHVHPMGAHRGDTLLGRVLWHVGARPDQPWTTCRPSLAHRLDRPTSGLVAGALDVGIRDRLQTLLEQRRVVRTYRAVVHGLVAEDEGVVDVPLGRDPDDRRRRAVVEVGHGGQAARSRWRVLDRDPAAGTTALELHLDTGRTHQLRVHLAPLGHPLVGDVAYGAPATGPPADPRVGSAISLRAVALRLPHPRTGAVLEVIAPRAAPTS